MQLAFEEAFNLLWHLPCVLFSRLGIEFTGGIKINKLIDACQLSKKISAFD